MVSDLTVRPATMADTTVLSLFATRTFREAFSHTVPPDAMAQYLHDSFHEAQVATELADPDTVFLLATDGSGNFAGYSKVYFGSTPPGSVTSEIPVKLWRLYTAREWQGQSVGALLLEHAVKIASERGGNSLWLTVNTNNTGALRFYERNGFVKVGFTEFNLGGELQRDFVMERRLGVRE